MANTSCRTVRASLRLDKKEPNGFLAKALDALKTHYGGMFPVQVIQLELLGKEELDEDVFLQVLRRTIESPELEDSYLTIPEVSIMMLKQLLEQVILLPNNGASLEKVFITFVHGLMHSKKCANTSLGIFQETIASLRRHYKQPLSEAATEATLISSEPIALEAFKLGKTQQGLENLEQLLKSAKCSGAKGCHVGKLLQYG
ncbi:hypothetical protein AtubIFM56815_009990 [Aspergillus tubingensis]|uniref:Uncharacterized protein n=1 Tax=Aspergillus tubingensis TaxID=5068 RepID=A0A9W6AQ17_ASPTU|nr:hypothetical protein AtubIFM56815_009990 [Aspergillus tubingensis]